MSATTSFHVSHIGVAPARRSLLSLCRVWLACETVQDRGALARIGLQGLV